MAASITEKLAALSLNDVKVYSHDAVKTGEEWKAALDKTADVPASYKLSKTVVFKPKQPKSDPQILLLALTLDETSANSGAVTKAAGTKDARLATPEAVTAALGAATPQDSSPFQITSENSAQVQVVLDAKLVASELVAVHANNSTETVFLSGADIKKYLESTGVKVFETDFTLAAVQTVAKTEAKKAPAKPVKNSAAISDAKLIGVGVDKYLDFSGWYQQVLTKGDMLDYYDVSGCYILKPWSYSIWEKIQKYFDAKIKHLGVENCYFPLFVSAKVLEREKDHVEGFAPEVAWVTRAGDKELDEPIAIRPTSETVMYPYYAKWIRSHRDLPLRLNQWNSVVRWEFKNPQPFLRTREFLWQEGHTAHLHREDAEAEVMEILDYYSRVYSELLAVPTIKGKKTEKEKFAGGLFTTTVEGYIPTTGRGIQGATSHCLGQNFSKMFNITVEDPTAKEGEKKDPLFVWQNSWGLSTRVIGVMVMIHGDNKGLVLPPAIANFQVVIVPCGLNNKATKEDREKLFDEVDAIAKRLKKADFRVKADLRESYTPGYKFNDWELKGVPLRLEIGPQDIKKNQVIGARRDNGEKNPIGMDNLEADIDALLKKIQSDMYAKAKDLFDTHVVKVTKWEDFVPALNKKNLILMPWCGVMQCEDDIKDRSARQAMDGEPEDAKAPSMGAKSLCIPFDQPSGEDAITENTKCPQCGEKAKEWVLWGRSY
ncbi:putative prolyl-tRNA synthetase C19C7.06 [Ascobolus immersus RN42]|uniref:proline--tRNA ligase n=1 Tax=Ascobolus immersus RN42 TaxID=1160509 RepID=A0A3N4HR52_ASCIM|nr:putative prolyl-tRNA synthetase C19C7.06 [Ascobolus immersus RN42]